MNQFNFIKKLIQNNLSKTKKNWMKKLILAALIFIGFSCNKTKAHDGPKTPEYYTRCGTLLTTPTLDSFVPPTYYITAIVAFPEGNELVHFHGDVTGDHDGSWFLSKYDKDSTYCSDPILKLSK